MAKLTEEQIKSLTKLIDDTQAEFENLLSDEDQKNWTQEAEQEGCKVFKRACAGSSLYYWQGVAKLENVTAEDYLGVFKRALEDPAILKAITSGNAVFNKIVQQFDGDKKFVLVHSQFTTGSYFVSDRDFVVARDIREAKDGKPGYSIVGSAVQDPKISGLYPSGSGVVRAITRWIMRLIPEGNSLVVKVINFADPCGSIPAFLTNKVSTAQGLLPLRYKNYFASLKK